MFCSVPPQHPALQQDAWSKKQRLEKVESTDMPSVQDGGAQKREHTGASAPQNSGVHSLPHLSWVPATSPLVSGSGEGGWQVGRKELCERLSSAILSGSNSSLFYFILFYKCS